MRSKLSEKERITSELLAAGVAQYGLLKAEVVNLR
jgi:hypothetical protein